MVVQTTDQLFSQAICTAWQLAFFRNVACEDDYRCFERVEFSVFQLGVQSCHGALDFSWAGNASQSDAGNDRRKLYCVARGARIAALLPQYGGVFAGAMAIAPTVAGDADATNWAEHGMCGETFLAVAGTVREGVRRLDGVDARHAKESSRVSSGLQPEAWVGFPDCQSVYDHVSVVWSGARHGD